MPQYDLMRCSPASDWLTIQSLASATGMNPELVEKFVTYGLVEPVRTDQGVAWFDVASIGRVRTIARLRRDLGINLAGIATAFDLLSQIEALKRELAELRTRYDRTEIPVRAPTGERWG